MKTNTVVPHEHQDELTVLKSFLNQSDYFFESSTFPKFLDEIHEGEDVLIKTSSMRDEIELVKSLKTELAKRYGKDNVFVTLAHNYRIKLTQAMLVGKQGELELKLREKKAVAIVGLQNLKGALKTTESLLLLMQNLLLDNRIVITSYIESND